MEEEKKFQTTSDFLEPWWISYGWRLFKPYYTQETIMKWGD